MSLDLIEFPRELGRAVFPTITYRGDTWDLSHLDSFAFKVDPDLGFHVDVVVLFSCHCFTRGFARDAQNEILDGDIFNDGREQRILDPIRYSLSKTVLPNLVHQLPIQKIIIANENQRNFMIWEQPAIGDITSAYAVFFDVEKDNRRKRRLILRIQSAYLLTEGITKRQKSAKKVGWNVLLKATYENRTIRP